MYKLSQVKNIFDNCLKSKNIILNFIVLSQQLVINCNYNTELMDFNFDINLDEIKVENTNVLDLNKKVFELEKELKESREIISFYKEFSPIVFSGFKINSSGYAEYADTSFYQKSIILCHLNVNSNINRIVSADISRLSIEEQNRYRRIRDNVYIYSGNNTRYGGIFDKKDLYDIIIPPGKMLKTWQNNNLEPTVYNQGIYKGIILNGSFLIWMGVEEYQYDIPENFECANFKNF